MRPRAPRGGQGESLEVLDANLRASPPDFRLQAYTGFRAAPDPPIGIRRFLAGGFPAPGLSLREARGGVCEHGEGGRKPGAEPSGKTMLTGYNTNYEHRGVSFHIQTEDSGRERPRIATHLFHGGTILASEKADYADRLESPELAEEVKALMETQHKAMLRRLVSGELDGLLAERLGEDVFPA